MKRMLLAVALAAGLVVVGATVPRSRSADVPPKKGEFAATTIDLGAVVSDVEKAVKFYT